MGAVPPSGTAAHRAVVDATGQGALEVVELVNARARVDENSSPLAATKATPTSLFLIIPLPQPLTGSAGACTGWNPYIVGELTVAVKTENFCNPFQILRLPSNAADQD